MGFNYFLEWYNSVRNTTGEPPCSDCRRIHWERMAIGFKGSVPIGSDQTPKTVRKEEHASCSSWSARPNWTFCIHRRVAFVCDRLQMTRSTILSNACDMQEQREKVVEELFAMELLHIIQKLWMGL